jgi:eukaryotic-like serine/threonine-protein kinase
MKRSMMNVSLAAAVVTHVSSVAAIGFPALPVRRCAPDAVLAGTVCLDRYEASVWRVPNPTTMNTSLVRKIQLGRATERDLTAGGATQLGSASDDYAPCMDNGQNCANDIYAVSLPSEIPSSRITWFQAQEACANAGKRLPTSAEWQVGANGTPNLGPDDHATTCNTSNNATTTLTGVRRGCVSARGAFDMVGNVAEWVAEWVPLSTGCPGWGSFSDDIMCLSGASTSGTGPGALLRGGFFFSGDASSGGPLAVIGTVAPTRSQDIFGFRCAR